MPEGGAALVLILTAVITLGALAVGMSAGGGGSDPTILALVGGIGLFGAVAAALKKQVG